MLDSLIVSGVTGSTDVAAPSTHSRAQHGTAIAALVLATLLGGCSNPEPADLESLGLAIAADVQPGERFELTAAKDRDISITSVSAPSGVTATVSEPDPATVTLSVAVDSGTPAGTYTLLLRTDRNGNGAELEWPFDVVDAEPELSDGGVIPAEEIRDRFVDALAAKDPVALQALWPGSSWESLGLDVIGWFVPAQPDAPCQQFDDGSATCFVFEDGVSRVLGLTMEPTGSDGWTITSVSLDSTN